MRLRFSVRGFCRALLFLGGVEMTEKKNEYENPEIHVIRLPLADVITASEGIDNDIDMDHGENDGEWM